VRIRSWQIYLIAMLVALAGLFNVRPVASEAGQTYPFFAPRQEVVTLFLAALAGVVLFRSHWWWVASVITIGVAFGVRWYTHFVMQY
jgi:hypothetical protein